MRILLALLLTCVIAAPAGAAWPERPVTIIVPFGPGGGADIAARSIGRWLEARLGQPFVIVNRGGAGGEIGFAATARAAPDGYTIGVITMPNLVTIPIERQAQYAVEQLAPVANLVDDVGGVFVRADSPFRSLADLVAAAKARPEAVSFGTTGVSMTDATAEMQAGQVRALGQMAARRWSGTPDVPTLREQGFDVVLSSMRGFAAPAGTPPEILRRLSDAIGAAAEDAEFRRLAERQAMPLRFLDSTAFAAEIAAQQAQYRTQWQAQPWRERE
jgi:tripartite-type tricarboxylate transporter receptor subunit TctC